MGFTNSKVQYRETPGIRKRFQYDYKTKTSTDYFIVVMSEPSGNLFKKWNSPALQGNRKENEKKPAGTGGNVGSFV